MDGLKLEASFESSCCTTLVSRESSLDARFLLLAVPTRSGISTEEARLWIGLSLNTIGKVSIVIPVATSFVKTDFRFWEGENSKVRMTGLMLYISSNAAVNVVKKHAHSSFTQLILFLDSALLDILSYQQCVPK
jgi:hypothetical protein